MTTAMQFDRDSLAWMNLPWQEFARVNGKRLPNLRDKPYLAPLVTRGKEILHAGCGDERYVLAFARAGATAFGIDSSSSLGERVNAGAKKLGLENAFGLTADIANLPLQNDLFDLYASFNVFDKFRTSQQCKILAEAHRVLKPGGLIYLEVPHFWSLWTLRRQLRYWFRRLIPPGLVWQRNLSRYQIVHQARKVGFQTVETHVLDAWGGFEKGFSLDAGQFHGFPNFFRWMRPRLHKVARFCDEREWAGNTLVYIGRKGNDMERVRASSWGAVIPVDCQIDVLRENFFGEFVTPLSTGTGRGGECLWRIL